MRLWLRTTIEGILGHLHELLAVVARRAAADIDILMPGYTHLQVRPRERRGQPSATQARSCCVHSLGTDARQRAQPIRWSHWMLMYGWMWNADAERLRQLLVRVNAMPLGASWVPGLPASCPS